MHRVNKGFKYFIRKPISLRSLIQVRSLISYKNNMEKSVILNKSEEKIKKLLIDLCNEYNQKCPVDQQLELRITGGWVRDKLLGYESHDLDIAINHLTGEEFASVLHDFLASKYPEMDLKSHTIKKNPDKSKHLETCTTKVFGVDIDFVNLRSETYSDESRVPIIECGTAEEDALRRDATLNALFYNINKDQIEDFTGRGLKDLADGILRTPLPPLKTFLDDPLRVLRLIRFASRFNFMIEDASLNAMRNEEIKMMFKNKISRERVGVEIEKTLATNNPQYGINLMAHVKLIESVFLVSTDSKVYDCEGTPSEDKGIIAYQDMVNQAEKAAKYFNFLQNSIHNSSFNLVKQYFDQIMESPENKKRFWLATIYFPLGNLTTKPNPARAAYQSLILVNIKEGLRFGKADYETVSLCVKEIVNRKNLLSRFLSGSVHSRSELGGFLRIFGSAWPLAIICSCVNDLLRGIDDFSLKNQANITPEMDLAGNKDRVEQVLMNYNAFFGTIHSMDLTNASEMKPIVDGRVLSKALGMKPGPWMGKVNRDILEWQLDNPEGTREECILHIKSIISKYVS